MNSTGRAGSIAGKMVRGTVATALHRIVEAVIGLFLVPFTLHRLGSDAYGLWALFYSLTLYLNLADLGFASSLNRHFVAALTAGNEDERSEVFSTGLAIMATFAIGIFLAGLLLEKPFIHFFPESKGFDTSAIWVWRSMLYILTIGFLTNYARSLFFSTHRTSHLALLNIVLAIVNAALIIAALELGTGLTGLAVATAASASIRILVTFSFGVHGTPGWGLSLSSIRRSRIAAMASFGLKVQLSRIADTINQQFDRVLLGRVTGLETVAHYDIGAKGASTTNLLPTTAYYVIEPAAATFASSGDRERFTSLLYRSSRYMAIVAAGIGAYLVVTARPILTLWLGSPPHPQIALALQVLILAYTVWTITVPIRLCARGAGHPEWEASAAVVQAGINVMLSIGLYYWIGFAGVLTGTLAAAVTGQTMLSIRAMQGMEQSLPRLIRASWLMPMLSACLAGVAAGIVLTLLPVPEHAGRGEVFPAVAASFLLFTLIFGGSLLALRGLKIAEICDLMALLTGKKKR